MVLTYLCIGTHHHGMLILRANFIPRMDNTYVLLISLPQTRDIVVGSNGECTFDEGAYAYVGSARSSAFSRINRHRRVSRGENRTRHWHIDYLLGQENSSVEESFSASGVKECKTADELELPQFDSFGASDCQCDTHLFRTNSFSYLQDCVRSTYQKLSKNFTWKTFEKQE